MGNGRNNGRNQGRDNGQHEYREFFPFLVNAVVKAALEFLKGKPGVVRIGKNQTILATSLSRTAKGLLANLVTNEVAQVTYFVIRATEAIGKNSDYARVICSPKGLQLPQRKLRRDEQGNLWTTDEGQIIYTGLTKCACIEAKVERGRYIFKITSVCLDQKTQTRNSIALTEEACQLDFPGILVERFYRQGANRESVPNQDQVEGYIQAAIAGNPDSKTLDKFVPAMAVAYRKFCGENTSMLDIAEDMEDKPAEQAIEKKIEVAA